MNSIDTTNAIDNTNLIDVNSIDNTTSKFVPSFQLLHLASSPQRRHRQRGSGDGRSGGQLDHDGRESQGAERRHRSVPDGV